MNPHFAGDKMDSFHLDLEFQLLRFMKQLEFLLHNNGNDFLIFSHLQQGAKGSDYDVNVAFHH